ncbi:MAG TPA: hypothetical protein VJ860_00265 [Polyangia bacterium]|jgi:hypothetical protein|nr:hypothetical protein [Polyangia bacterium]
MKGQRRSRRRTNEAPAHARPRGGPRIAVSLVVLGLLGAYAVWRVIHLAWTCDDAFISYRYAKHLVEGQGLVFNPGERVEGISNPLFTLLLAGMMAAGLEPRFASMALGAVAYLVVAATLAWWSYRKRSTTGLWLPLAACLWLAQDDLHVWGTGGLETTVFTALALGGMACLSVSQRLRGAVLGGVLLALACLTRPDGILFAAVGVAAPFLLRSNASRSGPRQALSQTVAVATPVLILCTGLLAFKLLYYGRILPTAFYAKSATDAYYTQGLMYVALYGAKHWAMSLSLVALPLAAWWTGWGRLLWLRRDALLALAAFALFTTYVAHSGGDFMFARRLVPALPFLFVFLDAAVSALTPKIGVALALSITAGSFLPYPLLSQDQPEFIHGISDERLGYPETVIAERRAQAQAAQDVFQGLPVRAAFGGGMCMFAYYSGLPYLVEPNGLTQYWIAERPLPTRGPKVGHEKLVSREELLQHGVEFIFHHDRPPLQERSPGLNQLIIDDALLVEVLVYDEALMDKLRATGRVRFRAIDDILRTATTDIQAMSCADAREAFAGLSDYYLDAHPDKAGPIREAMARACNR